MANSVEDAELENEVAALAFSWLERREESVNKLCTKIIGRSGFSFDEAKSECVMRVMNALRTCDFSKNGAASLDTHVLGTLRGYLIKLIWSRTPKREAWRKTRLFEHTTEESLQFNIDYETIENLRILESVLSELPADDFAALELYYIYEEPLDEIMLLFDCSRANASVRVHRALTKAKQIWDHKERSKVKNNNGKH